MIAHSSLQYLVTLISENIKTGVFTYFYYFFNTVFLKRKYVVVVRNRESIEMNVHIWP